MRCGDAIQQEMLRSFSRPGLGGLEIGELHLMPEGVVTFFEADVKPGHGFGTVLVAACASSEERASAREHGTEIDRRQGWVMIGAA